MALCLPAAVTAVPLRSLCLGAVPEEPEAHCRISHETTKECSWVPVGVWQEAAGGYRACRLGDISRSWCVFCGFVSPSSVPLGSSMNTGSLLVGVQALEVAAGYTAHTLSPNCLAKACGETVGNVLATQK